MTRIELAEGRSFERPSAIAKLAAMAVFQKLMSLGG